VETPGRFEKEGEDRGDKTAGHGGSTEFRRRGVLLSGRRKDEGSCGQTADKDRGKANLPGLAE